MPFDGFEPGEIRAKVESGEQLRANYGLDANLQQLIAQCRSVQPASRPSFAQILPPLIYRVLTARPIISPKKARPCLKMSLPIWYVVLKHAMPQAIINYILAGCFAMATVANSRLSMAMESFPPSPHPSRYSASHYWLDIYQRNPFGLTRC